MPEAPDPFDLGASSLDDDDIGLAPRVTPYDKIKRRRVHWIWPARIPAGKLAILDGDPDVGKSTLSLDIAARLTTATPMPDGYLPPAPINVLFLRAEDGAADTVLPRLLAAGADVARFMELVGIPELDDAGRLQHRPPELPADVIDLGAVISRYAIGMVLIDPLVAFLSDWVNANRDQAVRRALTPLAHLAETTGVTILAIRHLNKNSDAPTLYRGGGSIGLLAAARIVLVAGNDPDDKGRRLLGVLKSNLAPKPPTLAYRIVPHDLYECGQVQWLGASNKTAADILQMQTVDDDERSKLDVAVAFLFEILPADARDVMAEAKQAGIAERTLDRAKSLVGVRSIRIGGVAGKGRWRWTLPSTDEVFGDDEGDEE